MVQDYVGDPDNGYDPKRLLNDPSPLVQTLGSISEAVRGRGSAEEALRLAATFPLAQDSDPDICVFFFVTWFELCRQVYRFDEAKALIRRMESFIRPDTPPEVVAYGGCAQAQVAADEGNRQLATRLYRKALAGLPRQSARYPDICLMLAWHLAHGGEADELDVELSSFTRDAHRNLAGMIQLNQCVYTGRFEEARQLVRDRRLEPDKLPHHGDLIRTCSAWAEMAATSGDPIAAIPDLTGRGALLVAAHLLRGETDAALAEAHRLAAASLDHYIVRSGLRGHTLVRAELAGRHWQAAGRLLGMRIARGNRHFMDDFFLARVELLAGKRRNAERHFAAALSAVEKRQAEGLLDFELRMAHDLSRADLMSLVRSAGKAPARSAPDVRAADSAAKPAAGAPRRVQRLVGDSPAIRQVRATILKLAPLDVPVLIVGETGTGKELAARSIHEEGPRARRSFLAVNCGAIPESLLESELFGHVRGAFTGAERARRGLFEEAGDGTLLLDEIGDIPARLQVALLRVLEAGEIQPVGGGHTRRISCRILASTNANLAALVEAGTFRKDLYFRLRRMEICLPPLRARAEDVASLARHFLAQDRFDDASPGISEDLEAALTGRAWPGNVRELRNLIERLRLQGSEKELYGLGDLQAIEGAGAKPPKPGATGATGAAVRPDPAAPRTDAEASLAAAIASGRDKRRRLDREKDLFARFRKLTRGELIEAMGMCPHTLSRDLAALCREGFVRKVMPTRSPRTHYFELNDKGTG